MAAGSGAPPAKPWAPTWALASGETPGAADLAWVVAQRRGSKLHTAARVLTIVDQNSP
jgi:hypothetical protein